MCSIGGIGCLLKDSAMHDLLLSLTEKENFGQRN